MSSLTPIHLPEADRHHADTFWGGAQAEGGGQQGHHQAHGQGVSWFGLIVSDLTQIHWEDSILESKFDLNDSTILMVLYIFNSILESKFFGPMERCSFCQNYLLQILLLMVRNPITPVVLFPRLYLKFPPLDGAPFSLTRQLKHSNDNDLNIYEALH